MWNIKKQTKNNNNYVSYAIGFLIILTILLFTSGCSGNKSALNFKQCEDLGHKDLKYGCYMDAARANNDVKICDKIDEETPRIQCYSDIALLTKDIRICDDLVKEGNINNSDACYTVLSATLRKIEVCDKIKSKFYRYSCYSRVGQALGDPSMCDKIQITEELDDIYLHDSDFLRKSFQQERDSCYNWVAIGNKDKALCDKIIEESQKRYCHSETAK